MTIEEEIQYYVSFEGFGDEDLLKTVTKEIKIVVKDFSTRLPVSSLEEFVFAKDYNAALNSLDRGFETDRQIVPTETKEFVGVGMPLAVVSEWNDKNPSGVACGGCLLSNFGNKVMMEGARHILVHMLASSALRGLIANKFPKQVLRPLCDQFEAFLHDYVSGVFEAYFCAYFSTGSESQFEHRESLALGALKLALEQIPDKRRAYILDGDLEGFFDASANMIQNVLTFIAALFGSYKACGLMIHESSPISMLLAEHELDQWAELFRADLEGFHAGLEQWADFTEIFFINRHFQRLLAHFGIVPDRYEGFGAYVHVPWIATDLNI